MKGAKAACWLAALGLAASNLSGMEARIPIYKNMIITAPGHYVVTRDIASPTAPVIDVQVAGVVLDLNGHELSTASTTAPVIDISGGSAMPGWWRIRGGRLTGGSRGIHKPSGNSGDQVYIQDVSIASTSADGILLASVDLADLRGVDVEGAGGGGIDIMGDLPTATFRVRDCILRDTGAHGIYLHTGAMAFPFATTLTGNTVRGAGGYGIRVDGGGGGNVSENHVSSFGGTTANGAGIHYLAEPRPDPLISLLVSNNSITGGGSDDDGVRVVGVSTAIVMDNISQHNGRYGMVFDCGGCRIAGNTVASNLNHGMVVMSGGTNSLFDSNVIEKNGGNALFFAVDGGHAYRNNMWRNNGLNAIGGPLNLNAGGNIN